jgi:hypothetical protein
VNSAPAKALKIDTRASERLVEAGPNDPEEAEAEAETNVKAAN